jgi:hypothetical protein
MHPSAKPLEEHEAAGHNHGGHGIRPQGRVEKKTPSHAAACEAYLRRTQDYRSNRDKTSNNNDVRVGDNDHSAGEQLSAQGRSRRNAQLDVRQFSVDGIDFDVAAVAKHFDRFQALRCPIDIR